MDTQVANDETCGPQLILSGDPTTEWAVDELGRYAQAQHQVIVDSERLIAPAYWRLGLALNLARRNFHYRQWGTFLDQTGIDKTRASKARAIHRAFEREQDVVGLSVEQAYECRERKTAKRKADKRTRKENRTELADFFNDVSKKAEALIDQAGFADQSEAVSLLPLVADAIGRLERVRDLLQQQTVEN